MIVVTRHVCEGEYSEVEENLCSVYCVSFVFDLIQGWWTSNLGGTYPKVGVVSGVLFVIIKKGRKCYL